MANDRYRWLDEEAAERLLCGELSEARPSERSADTAFREPVLAGRIAAALGALAPPVGTVDGQRLPGEDAAVAAFRTAHDHPQVLHSEGLAERTLPMRPVPVAGGAHPVRSARVASNLPAGHTGAGHTGPGHTGADRPGPSRSGTPAAAAHSGPPAASAAPRSDRAGRPERPGRPVKPAGSTRPGGTGPRRNRFPALGRPLRTGFALAVAGCALGGVAVATGGGLPTFGGGGGGAPTPSTSVSTQASPGPSASTSPSTPDGSRHPDDDPRRPGATVLPPGAPDGSPSATGGTGRQYRQGVPGLGGDPESVRNALRELCRAYQGGGMDPADRLLLERSAGGADSVRAFCASRAYERGGEHPGGDSGEREEDGTDPGRDQDHDDGDQDRDEDGESPEPSREPEQSGRPTPWPSGQPSTTPEGGTGVAPTPDGDDQGYQDAQGDRSAATDGSTEGSTGGATGRDGTSGGSEDSGNSGNSGEGTSGDSGDSGDSEDSGTAGRAGNAGAAADPEADADPGTPATAGSERTGAPSGGGSTAADAPG